MKDLERILKALANKRRLAILKHLKGGKASVSDIAKTIKLSFKATSKHLTILTGAGILEKEQDGLIMWHSLSGSKNPLVSKVLDII